MTELDALCRSGASREEVIEAQADRIAWLEHNLASANQAFEEMKALSLQRLEALKEAERQRESLLEQFDAVEHDRDNLLNQVLMLREAIDRQPYTMDKQVCEALATTAGLDGLILCEREPVGKTYRDFSGTKLELSRTLIPGEFLYRAARKEQVK